MIYVKLIYLLILYIWETVSDVELIYRKANIQQALFYKKIKVIYYQIIFKKIYAQTKSNY